MIGLLRFLPPLRKVLPSLALIFAMGLFLAQSHVLADARSERDAALVAVEQRDIALADAEQQAAAAIEKAERILENEKTQSRRLASRLNRLAAAQHECLAAPLPLELLE